MMMVMKMVSRKMVCWMLLGALVAIPGGDKDGTLEAVSVEMVLGLSWFGMHLMLSFCFGGWGGKWRCMGVD